MGRARSFVRGEPPEGLARGLLDRVQALAAPHGLMTMGGLYPDGDLTGRTLVLIGTAPDFWQQFRRSPEHDDGQPDPVDRWSRRILPRISEAANGTGCIYPFGGPPHAPFIAWAKQTGEAFDSPTGMLVHVRAGLMISYRGAIMFDGRIPLPDQLTQSPCDSCADRACVTACPVDALSDLHSYDVPACKGFLATDAGSGCMTRGCAVRRACPVSQRFGRSETQSAHHMRAFKGA